MYALDASEVQVVAFLHAARDFATWRRERWPEQ
jgi:hypothetical protein